MALMVGERLLTRADLDALPDDNLRHELIDGAFVMTPAPGRSHQRMVLSLYRLLWNASRRTDLEVLVAPFDVVLGSNVVEPDLVVAPSSAFAEQELSTAPTIVVEVRSHSTAWIDRGRKRELYQEAGVSHYWLVEPRKPSITVLKLVAGEYIVRGEVTGDQSLELDEPFPVVLNPTELARG